MPQRWYAVLAPVMVLQYAIGGAFLPFSSLYFRDRGLDYTELGWVYFTAAAVSACMPVVWGVLADRLIAVNRLLVALHIAGAGILLSLAFQSTFVGLLVFFGLWSTIGLPTNSLLNALSYHNIPFPETQFGRLRLWGSVGWMLPSLPVALWLGLTASNEFQFAIFLACGIELCYLLAALVLPYTPPAGKRPDGSGTAGPEAEGGGESATFSRALGRLILRPRFLVLFLIAFLMHWSFAATFYYSPLYLERWGVERTWIGPAQCVGVIVEVPLFWLLPIVLPRLGYRRTLAIGCGALLVRQLLFVFYRDLTFLISSAVLVGATVVFYLIPMSLAVNALAGRRLRATAQTLLLIAGPGLGQMAGHLITGSLAKHLGLRAVFVAATITTLVALLLLPWVRTEPDGPGPVPVRGKGLTPDRSPSPRRSASVPPPDRREDASPDR